MNQLYLDLLERPPSPAERRHLLSALERCGGHPDCLYRQRHSNARDVFESPDHLSLQNLYEGPPDYSARYVTRAFTGFARRRPEEREESSWHSGIPNIIEKLLTAPVYRKRFGPP